MAKNNVNLAGIVIKFSKTNANLNMTKMTKKISRLSIESKKTKLSSFLIPIQKKSVQSAYLRYNYL